MSYKADFAKADKARKIKTVSPSFFSFEKKGDCVMGRLLGTSDIPSALGGSPYKQYIVETDDGLVKFAMGGATDKELALLLVEGEVYRFTFQGEIKIKGGKRVNKFVVDQVAEGEEPEPPAEAA